MNFSTQSAIADRMTAERRKKDWRLKAWAWFRRLRVRQDFLGITIEPRETR